MKKVYETVFSLISNGVHSLPNYEVIQNYKQLLLGITVGTEKTMYYPHGLRIVLQHQRKQTMMYLFCTSK